MTTRAGVEEARARLSDSLDRVTKGEEIAITRRGREVARLVPSPAPARPPRWGGWLTGEFSAALDREETPVELIDLMDGKDGDWWRSSSTPTRATGEQAETPGSALPATGAWRPTPTT